MVHVGMYAYTHSLLNTHRQTYTDKHTNTYKHTDTKLASRNFQLPNGYCIYKDIIHAATGKSRNSEARH